MTPQLLATVEIDTILRRAKNGDEALVLSVNLLRKLFPYEMAVAFTYKEGYHPSAHSDIPYIDPKTPFIKEITRYMNRSGKVEEVEIVSAEEISSALPSQGIAFGMVIPIRRYVDKALLGGLLVCSAKGFSKDATVVASHIAETLSLVLGAHTPKIHIPWNKRHKLIAAGVVGFLLLAIQMPLSTLGNAQVVAKDPLIITAPMNGIIKQVDVKSNDVVKRGDFLLSFDDVEIRGKQQVASETINISAAEVRKQERAAFFDEGIKNRLNESRAENEVKRMEYDAITSQLDRLTMYAPQKGTVVLDDPTALIGMPVKTGEKLLSIVDPQMVHVEILVDAHNANLLNIGDEAHIYLDNDPMDGLSGKITDIAYEPVIAPSNILSYKAYVKLDPDQKPPAIGMCGKAKIKGGSVPLIWYLLRKPIAYARWYLG